MGSSEGNWVNLGEPGWTWQRLDLGIYAKKSGWLCSIFHGLFCAFPRCSGNPQNSKHCPYKLGDIMTILLGGASIYWGGKHRMSDMSGVYLEGQLCGQWRSILDLASYKTMYRFGWSWVVFQWWCCNMLQCWLIEDYYNRNKKVKHGLSDPAKRPKFLPSRIQKCRR